MKTTIVIEDSTRDLLRHVGRKEQTYDQVIKELIKRSFKNGNGGATE
jgi:effector-binding domain-containing protein